MSELKRAMAYWNSQLEGLSKEERQERARFWYKQTAGMSPEKAQEAFLNVYRMHLARSGNEQEAAHG